MQFSRHVHFAISRSAYYATLEFRDLAEIFMCILNHFNFAFSSYTRFISLPMLLKHVLEFNKPTLYMKRQSNKDETARLLTVIM